MIIIWLDDKKEVSEEFIQKLRDYISTWMLYNFKKEKVKYIQDYFNLIYDDVDKIDIAKECMLAFDSLIIDKTDKFLRIKTDDKKKINNIQVESIIKLINNGPLGDSSILSYPFIEELLRDLEKNYDLLYNYYMNRAFAQEFLI